jgi:hypothetical protein
VKIIKIDDKHSGIWVEFDDGEVTFSAVYARDGKRVLVFDSVKFAKIVEEYKERCNA